MGRDVGMWRAPDEEVVWGEQSGLGLRVYRVQGLRRAKKVV